MDFIGGIGNFAGNRTLRYVVSEETSDAQVSYTFSDGSSLAGLSLLFQVSNLTNEVYQTYAERRIDRWNISNGAVTICWAHRSRGCRCAICAYATWQLRNRCVLTEAGEVLCLG